MEKNARAGIPKQRISTNFGANADHEAEVGMGLDEKGAEGVQSKRKSQARKESGAGNTEFRKNEAETGRQREDILLLA